METFNFKSIMNFGQENKSIKRFLKIIKFTVLWKISKYLKYFVFKMYRGDHKYLFMFVHLTVPRNFIFIEL